MFRRFYNVSLRRFYERKKELSFEESLEQLEEIVKKLEVGDFFAKVF